ncbi:alpha/beta hydrolase [Vibrio sp. S11_S32]|uniref:alpha/beta hydrolase n=1 Tax=Vibrio sp. S11_S32 TaxID=2720225 RepID=UPI0016809844|nr:alpha/beta hydrolase [Vibrio sp. S11_S32]MBD1578020.1 alpha/beta hydrolase [Vibrio sp. S11_S32]
MKRILGLFLSALSFMANAEPLVVYDSSRDRSIPLEIGLPLYPTVCSLEKQCNVAFISAGNRVPFQKYKFLSDALNELGYMTIAVDHELPNDPPLSKTGDLYQTRIENWSRGAQTLDFLQEELALRFASYNFNNLTLVGHSNGGDISTWLSNENKSYISQLITLDHKRVTLPKTSKIRVLSLRSPEYPTKIGILPTIEEQQLYDSCIVEIPASKHMDFTDYGTNEMKQKTIRIVASFIKGTPCMSLKTKT